MPLPMPIPQAVPHDSWAAHYDRVYELTFGAAYQRFTDVTLAEIERVVPPPLRVVDFGAGTGRLALPLAARGYEVLAVEPSAGMLRCLAGKAGAERVSVCQCLLQDFCAEQPFDVALCVFTVMAYLTDEDALRAGLGAMAAALKPSGRLLLDIPMRAAFWGMHKEEGGMTRDVVVRSLGGDLFRYEERTRLVEAGGEWVYEDAFDIRFWEPEVVRRLAGECGLVVVEDVSGRFVGTGAGYWWLGRG